MGYAYGIDGARAIGYGVIADCDQPSCAEVIDRGMAFKCQNCEGFYCHAHLSFNDIGPCCVRCVDLSDDADIDYPDDDPRPTWHFDPIATIKRLLDTREGVYLTVGGVEFEVGITKVSQAEGLESTPEILAQWERERRWAARTGVSFAEWR